MTTWCFGPFFNLYDYCIGSILFMFQFYLLVIKEKT